MNSSQHLIEGRRTGFLLETYPSVRLILLGGPLAGLWGGFLVDLAVVIFLVVKFNLSASWNDFSSRTLAATPGKSTKTLRGISVRLGLVLLIVTGDLTRL